VAVLYNQSTAVGQGKEAVHIKVVLNQLQLQKYGDAQAVSQ
jgi:hypothetical protein